ncbi:hypothetical protein N9F00_02385 [Planktomarina temperata]|nr:hypothetical protein [Planktomarina temperata]
MKKLLHSSLLTFALIISGQSFARAGELIFGEGDKWVVFQGPILTEEMDGILSQLDDKKPEQILLNSVGGNLTGAIRFAKYVREKEMETWISRNQTCASACALIFFAGVERFSEGKLIVHQYLPTAGQGDAMVTWDRAFIGVQSMVWQIVTLLNNFGTPPFVLSGFFSVRTITNLQRLRWLN